MPWGNPSLPPIIEAGSGQVRDKEKARLNEIISRVNELFEGDMTDQDKLIYVNDVLVGKLLENKVLIQQSRQNTREQFGGFT